MKIDEQNIKQQFELEMKSLNDEYENKQCSFSDVENIGTRLINALPKLNFDKLRDEMDKMHVDIYENPTTFQLSEAMAKVQEYKNRLSTIVNDVEHEYLIRKRVNDMLFDANQAISKQSSADKRRGEATIRYPMLLIQYEAINSFRSEVSNIMNNLRSVGDIISRQASIISMQISLGEYRKKMPNELNGNDIEERKDYKSGVSELQWTDTTK